MACIIFVVMKRSYLIEVRGLKLIMKIVKKLMKKSYLIEVRGLKLFTKYLTSMK